MHVKRSKRLKPAQGESLDDLLEVNRLAIVAHEGWRAWMRQRYAGHPKLPAVDVPFEACTEFEQQGYRAAARAVRDAVLVEQEAQP